MPQLKKDLFNMKLATTILFILFTLSSPGFALAEEDTPEARAQLVDQYFSIAPISNMLDEMVQEMAKQVPDDKSQLFINAVLKNLQVDVIEAAAKESMVKHLTLDELKVYVAFMKQPEARSVMHKMKFYMADLMPVLQQEHIRAIKLTTKPTQYARKQDLSLLSSDGHAF